MSAAGRVRDPVHGYIRFTRIERRLIDDSLSQRLRYVAQAGLAHMVFPEVRSTRFAHSLGAMHLASGFFAVTLANAASDLKPTLERLLRDAVNETTDGYGPNEGDVVTRLTADGLQAGTSVGADTQAAALLIEQGLRLSALVHDLGHLPFSHDFEYALEHLFEDHRELAHERFPALTGGGDDAVHEKVGYRLAATLVRKIFTDDLEDRAEADIARTAFGIATRVLSADPPADADLAIAQEGGVDTTALWWWLHSLMAGEIDVDRCDYLLRDARSYGFEFASYDLARLADHLTVVRPREDRNWLETAVLSQGSSAAESFFLARYRAYAWGPFHHKVSQIAAALQFSIGQVLEPAIVHPAANAELSRFLGDIEAVAADTQGRLHESDPDLLARLRNYDDGWFTQQLRRTADTTTDPLAAPWLQLVCWRLRGPVSLWKRATEFPGDIQRFNEALPDPDAAEQQAAWRARLQELAAEGVLVIRHGFRPFRSAEGGASAFKVSDRRGTLVPLTDVSRLTASLNDVWSHDVQVYAFAVGDNPPDARDVMARLSVTTEQGGG
jgi:HD superfamily phosphohydrolase